jgi:hypothetical protein
MATQTDIKIPPKTEETKEVEPQNVIAAPTYPPKRKEPQGGWQGALFNIATNIDIGAASMPNQDDALRWKRFAELIRDEVAPKVEPEEPTPHATKSGK